jgi:hypothetical protein
MKQTSGRWCRGKVQLSDERHVSAEVEDAGAASSAKWLSPKALRATVSAANELVAHFIAALSPDPLIHYKHH